LKKNNDLKIFYDIYILLMVVHTCEKCHKEFNKKSTFVNHLKKKNKCDEQNNDIYNINKSNTDNTNDNLYNNDISDKINEFNCLFCNKILTTKGNLKKHINNNCKVKKQQDKEKEELFKVLVQKDKEKENLSKELLQKNKEKEVMFKELLHKDKIIEKIVEQTHILIKQNQEFKNEIIKKNNQLCSFAKQNKKLIMKNNQNNVNTKVKMVAKNNNVNITNNNNNINFFNIVQFGKEDINDIKPDEFLKIVKNPRLIGHSVPLEIVKSIHFNSDYPQYHNFYISDFNREKCMIYDGNKWIVADISKLNNVLTNAIDYSHNNLVICKEKFKNNKEVELRLKRIEDAINNCDEDFIKELIDNNEDESIIVTNKIKNCQEFRNTVLNKLKEMSYNERLLILNKTTK
jgi:hypothetical protein